MPKEGANGIETVRGWFGARGWTPWGFQEEAWAAYAEGRSGLIHVPTGAGKTYAAFGGPLAELIEQPGPGCRVLYITPLRAVARDIELALGEPCVELAPGVRVESRTGDTSQSVRTRQNAKLPQVLVTTPESLNLFLTRADWKKSLGGVRAVIVDEWHELMSSKRGTQTELALTRLRSASPHVRTWALSATIANLEEAARAAAGVRDEPVIVRGEIDRPIRIDSVIPSDGTRMPWAGHLGLTMLDDVLDALDPERSTLVFTNTRCQAERWFHAITFKRPEWKPIAALHHGSIERDDRAKIEMGLKDGSVRLVVATSSLDLGVDFSPVERVFQIGSPKGVARLMQRAGRSAHRPGETCEIVCVPTHALELIEVAAVRRGIAEGIVEPRTPTRDAVDVLAQHMVTCGLGGGFDADELYEEVRSAESFSELAREAFDWALRLVERGGGTLGAYPEFRKVELKDGLYRVRDRRIAQMHRMNVGTIAGTTTLEVRYLSGKRLGHIDESFVAHLRGGQKFVFAGRVLEYVRLHNTTVQVRRSRGNTTYTPKWAGTKLPITESMSELMRRTIEAVGDGEGDCPELVAAAPIIAAQARASHVPRADELLIEVCTTGEGSHLFVYPFEGRLVHGGLAALVAYRLARGRPATFELSYNDYGFELLGSKRFDFIEVMTPAIFSSEDLIDDAVASVNMGELAKLQFREVARVAGLVNQNFPGGHKSGRQLSANSGLIYDVLRDFEPESLLLKQAEREVLERQFEQTRLARTLERLRGAKWVVTEPDRPTPLGYPLVIERTRGTMTSETLGERLARMRSAWATEASTSAASV